jgi:hypothetical protein
MVSLARRRNDLYSEAKGRFFAAVHGMMTGDAPLAEHELQSMTELADRLKYPWLAGATSAVRADLAFVRGEWDEARNALARWKSSSDPQFQLSTLPGAVDAQRGNTSGAFEQLDVFKAHLSDSPAQSARGVLVLSGHISRTTGEPPATAIVQQAVATLRAAGLLGSNRGAYDGSKAGTAGRTGFHLTGASARLAFAMTLAYLPSVKLDDDERRQLMTLLTSASPYMFGTFGHVSRALATVHGREGRADDAVKACDEAIAFARKAGYRWELAWALHDQGQFLKTRAGPGDNELAAKSHDESLTIARELGMQPLIERNLASRTILKA